MQMHWEEIILHIICYQLKYQPLYTKTRYKKDYISSGIVLKKFLQLKEKCGNNTWRMPLKNGLIKNIEHRCNQFRTIVEQNLNSF